MHARLAETMSFVEEKRKELLESFEGVPGDRLRRRAASDGWSVAEILEHLRMVEAGVARLIAKRATQAREAGLGEETSTTSVMPSFDRYAVMLDSATLKSPPTVQPRPDVDVSEAIEGLQSSREALRAAVVAANGLALGEVKHTHPVVGELDLYQWLIFLGQHEGRHRKQIERTLKSIPE
ncbi:MAG: DinB family protein [Gemmatimonadaceae bacterium]